MSLPSRPSLEYLKKLAKDQLTELQRADASAKLADAQRAVARSHGFTSWRKLRAHLESMLPAAAPERTDWPDSVIEEFFGAINRGDDATVRRMLAADHELANARHPEGSTALTAAVDHNRIGILEALLQHGADATRVYAHSAHTPLSWAVTIENFEAARVLMRAGVASDLYCAAGMGDVAAVRAFFDAAGRVKPGASKTGSSRYTPDGVRLPCPPESAREVVADALYIASRNGQVDAVKILLAHDPDLSFRAYMGATALHWAEFAGSRPIVDLLQNAGADPGARDGVLKCTPRAFAICAPANWGFTAKVRQRLADDRSLANIMEGRGTPLHEAAREGHLEIVKLLIENGAEASVRDADGKTPRDLALARPDHARCAEVAAWLANQT